MAWRSCAGKCNFAVPFAHMKLGEDRIADYLKKNEAIWGKEKKFVGIKQKAGESLTRDPSV